MTESNSKQKKSGQYAELPLRIISGVILAGFALFCTWMGGQTYLLLASVAALLIFIEFRDMVKTVLPNRIAIFALGFLVLLVVSYFVERPQSGLMIALMGAALIGVWELVVRRSFWGAVLLLYCALPFVALVELRAGEYGLFIVLFVFACVWGADTFAYFAGKTFGGPKLAPSISPNKTWSGFFGGFAGAILISALLKFVFGYPLSVSAIFLAIILAFFSQIGDLFESWIKRRFGFKDSGKIIPGHGGILDRIDGLIFAVVAAWLVSIIINRTGLEDKLLPLSLIETFFKLPL